MIIVLFEFLEIFGLRRFQLPTPRQFRRLAGVIAAMMKIREGVNRAFLRVIYAFGRTAEYSARKFQIVRFQSYLEGQTHP